MVSDKNYLLQQRKCTSHQLQSALLRCTFLQIVIISLTQNLLLKSNSVNNFYIFFQIRAFLLHFSPHSFYLKQFHYPLSKRASGIELSERFTNFQFLWSAFLSARIGNILITRQFQAVSDKKFGVRLWQTIYLDLMCGWPCIVIQCG